MRLSKKFICAALSSVALVSAQAAPAPVAAKPVKINIESDPSMGGTAWMDYAVDTGTYNAGRDNMKFSFRFEGDRDDCITLSDATAGHGKTLVRMKDIAKDRKISFNAATATSAPVCIKVDEVFMLKNANGYYLQGRLNEIRAEKKTGGFNVVSFQYRINPDRSANFKALSQAPGVPDITAKAPLKKPRKP